MDAACSKLCALGLGLALGLMSGLTPTDAVAQEDTPVLAQIDARPAALLAEFGRASRPLLPTVLDWNDADHRAMIEGLFAAAQMSEEDRATLQEVFARAGSGTHAGIRARTPSLGDLAAEPDDYWIGPVTSVFDMENTGDTLAVNAVVSMAAPPARCFGLLGLSPDANFERVQTSVVQREFSCADLQLRVEGTSDLFAASTSQDGTPTAIAVSAAEYPDGEVHFLASTTSAVSSGGFTASSTLLEGPVNATQVVEAYRVLRDYQAALMRLANAATVVQARTASDGILAQFGKLATMLDPDSRAAANLAAAAPRVTGVLGLGLDQYRIAALRHAVRGADSAVGEISGLALDWYLDRPGSPVALASDLRVANDRVFAARDAADPVAYAAAVAELEVQHAAYLAAWDASAARPFARYRTAHTRLLNRLTDAAKPEDFTQPLQDLDAAFDN